jgi:hypothetical protein
MTLIASVLLVNTKTGDAVDPILVDHATGRPIKEPEYAFAAGPAASEPLWRTFACRLAPLLAARQVLSVLHPPGGSGKKCPTATSVEVAQKGNMLFAEISL